MTELAKRVNPRVVLLVGLALAAVVVLRRARGQGEGEAIVDPGMPLGGVPAPGFGDEGFADESTTPLTIPLPPQGGVIVVPGFDPIVYEPPPPAADTPAAPTPGHARGAWFGGQFWTPGERKQFRTWWRAWRRRQRKPYGEGAWERFLAKNPDLARALGFPVIPPPPAPAPAPQPIPSPGTPQGTSSRDVGTGGQTLAPAPGNRRAAVEAPRVIRPSRPPAARILPHTPATRPGARLERRRRARARR